MTVVQTILLKFYLQKNFLLRHKINLGQGAALQTGIDFAKLRGAKYYITFDSDGQHNIKMR